MIGNDEHCVNAVNIVDNNKILKQAEVVEKSRDEKMTLESTKFLAFRIVFATPCM